VAGGSGHEEIDDALGLGGVMGFFGGERVHLGGGGITVLAQELSEGDGSQANAASYNPSLSADGRFVAFWSEASNLTPDDKNAKTDVFLLDLTSLFLP